MTRRPEGATIPNIFPAPRSIEFSPWAPWKDRREKLENKDCPRSLGVYLWAHFHESPSRKVHPYPKLPRELIYVGETKDLNMRPLRGNGHQRLVHYGDTFPADTDFKYLYVSVYHVEPYDGSGRAGTLRAYTRYVEDKILWEYVQQYGERAALDYKKRPGRDVVVACCAEAPKGPKKGSKRSY